MTKQRRKTLVIDRSIQGGLLGKAAFYWLLSWAVVFALCTAGWVFVAPGSKALAEIKDSLPPLLGAFFVAAVSLIIVLFAVLYDLAKHTNRIVGPIYRLHRMIREAADGKPVAPLKFRKQDHWHELAEDFNRLLARLNANEPSEAFDSFVEYDTLVAVGPSDE